ncbi:hypothetical protein [Streptomyces sp. NPDC014733]|uniref:terpene synthase family protein n=1 Tax=Streptomyces sp. NPDC014733 TaxID=3364885 RepID=UPI0036FA15A6
MFHLPFPPGESPDIDAARQRSLAWCRKQRLVAHPTDEQRFLRWDIAGLMAAWCPRASQDPLDLTVDAVVVATFLDDQIDGPLADRPDQVGDVCQDFTEVISSGGRAPAGAAPLITACAHVWKRLAEGSAPDWLERTGQHWQWYLDAYTREARNRAHGRVPTSTEYFALRRRSGFVYAMLDLSQKAYGFELPHHLHGHPVLRRMLDITVDVVDTLNDVHSVEKEESRGDLHNLVLVLEHERGCDRPAGIRAIQQMITSWYLEFLALEQQAFADLSGQDVETAGRWVDCMRTAMSGYLHWSRTCLRYSQLVPPGEPALVADLVQRRH